MLMLPHARPSQVPEEMPKVFDLNVLDMLGNEGHGEQATMTVGMAAVVPGQHRAMTNLGVFEGPVYWFHFVGHLSNKSLSIDLESTPK